MGGCPSNIRKPGILTGSNDDVTDVGQDTWEKEKMNENSAAQCLDV